MRAGLALLFVIGSSAILYADDASDLQDRTLIIDFNLMKRDLPEKRVGLHFLDQLYRTYPNFDPAKAISIAGKVEEAFRKRDHSAEIETDLGKLADVALAVTGGDIDLKTLRSMGELTYGAWRRQSLDLEARLTHGARTVSEVGPYSLVQSPHNITSALELAGANAKAETAIFTYLKLETGNQKLADPIDRWIRANVEAGKAVVEARSVLSLRRIQTSVEAGREEMQKMRREVALLSRRLAKDAAKAPAATSGKSDDRKLDDVESNIYGFLALNNAILGLTRKVPELQIAATFVDAHLRTLLLVEKLAFKKVELTGALCSAAGLWLTAFSTVAQLLDSSPSASELILREIAALRQDLVRLQQYLAAEFAALHEQLAQLQRISLVILDRLDRLDLFVRHQTKVTQQLILENSYRTVVIGEKIDAVRGELFDVVSEMSERELRPLFLRATWEEISGDTFRATLDRFKTCATLDSLDAAATGPRLKFVDKREAIDRKHREFMPAVFSVFNGAFDTWSRMGALSEAAEILGFPFDRRGIVNARIWAMCTDGYLQLARKWPAKYRQYAAGAKMLEHIIATGFLATAHLQALGRTGRTRDEGLLAAALAAYRDAFSHLNGELAKFHRQNFSNQANDSLKGINPFAALAEQKDDLPEVKLEKVRKVGSPITFYDSLIPAEKRQPWMVVRDAEFEVPAKLQEKLMQLVPLEARAANKMGLGRIETHWRPVATQVISTTETNLPDAWKKQFRRTNASYFPSFRPGIEWVVQFHWADGRESPVVDLASVAAYSDRWYWIRKGSEGDKRTYFDWRHTDFVGRGGRGTYPEADNEAEFLKELWGKVQRKMWFQITYRSLEPKWAKWADDGFQTDDEAQMREWKALFKYDAEISIVPMKADHPLNLTVVARMSSQRKEFLATAKKIFENPSGPTYDVLARISGAKEFALRVYSLLAGDFVSTHGEGKKMLDLLKALPAGADVARAIAAGADQFLSTATREAAVHLLTVPAARVEAQFKKLGEDPALAAVAFSARHPFLAKTLGEAEVFHLRVHGKVAGKI